MIDEAVVASDDLWLGSGQRLVWSPEGEELSNGLVRLWFGYKWMVFK